MHQNPSEMYRNIYVTVNDHQNHQEVAKFIQFFDMFDTNIFDTFFALCVPNWNYESEEDRNELIEIVNKFFDALAIIFDEKLFTKKVINSSDEYCSSITSGKYLSLEEFVQICSFIEDHDFLAKNDQICCKIRTVHAQIKHRGMLFCEFYNKLENLM
jgi:hypothetical protein